MKFLFSLFAAALLASPALSTTVTFDTGPDNLIEEGGTVLLFESQGFRFETSSAYPTDGTITMHDDSGITTSTIRRADGAEFTPKSMLFAGYSRMFRTGETEPPDFDLDLDAFLAWTQAGAAKLPGLIFKGFFSSGLTVTKTIVPDLTAPPGMIGPPQTFSFGAEFAGISALSVTLLLPDPPLDRYYEPTELTLPDTDWCFEWCAEVQVDQMVVADPAPVPLPASGLLLGGAALALVRLRHRRA